MKKLLRLFLWAALPALAAFVLYLAYWPIDLAPRYWQAPPAPALTGIYAPNQKLAGMQRFLEQEAVGPEAVNIDANGRVYAGLLDGRVLQINANGNSYTEMTQTGGRPLGLTFGPNGGIVIADGKRGLLHHGSTTQTLLTEVAGQKLRFADDVDNAQYDKNVYFSDASGRYGLEGFTQDFIEHSGTGRLIQYNMQTRESKVLVQNLHFANGVAVGPNDEYVLVVETQRFRVLRYWLKGSKAGQMDVFIDNLPGFPDNISFNGQNRFWLAIYGPRNAQFDALVADKRVWMRKLAARLPAWLQPKPKTQGFVLGLDLDGKVVANLQDDSRNAYAPITSVREYGPWLYFGSLSARGIARLPLAEAIDGVAPPTDQQKTPPDANPVRLN
jgi:sugar lactone lactonase YvrE